MAHTPGNWILAKRLGSWHWLVAVEDTNLEICQMFHDGTPENETGEANAKLCSAAPDMAEALKALIPPDFDDHPQDFKSEWHDAKAALKKAGVK